jgi:uncharacterized membrane protein
MPTIEQSIEVNVPVSTAYNQWTQFEEFPRFMEGVESITQLDDTSLRWVAEIAGQKHEWKAEITEQIPDERVAWKAVDGKTNAGVVTFHRIGDNTSKVMVQMDWQPEGAVEKAGAAIGADDARVKGDLKRFKELIEARGTETGAWRGEVDQTSN